MKQGPVLDYSEMESQSSSSMSGYGSEDEDVEAELQRELIQLTSVRPRIVVRAVQEESSLQEYFGRFSKMKKSL